MKNSSSKPLSKISYSAAAELSQRRTKKQKAAFRKKVVDKFYAEGYTVFEERSVPFGAHINLIIGDIDSADTIFTARYSSRPTLFIPNIISKKSKFIHYLYRILVFVAFMFISLFVENLVFAVTEDIYTSVLSYCISMAALLLILFFGPSFQGGANDNTSGIIALLEAALGLSPETIAENHIAFAFIDDGAFGYSGAVRLFHEHDFDDKTVINIDSPGKGDNLVYFCSRAISNESALQEKIIPCIPNHEKIINTVSLEKKSPFRSDGNKFPRSINVSAFPKSGISLSRRTILDKDFSELNISLVKEFIISLSEGRNENV